MLVLAKKMHASDITMKPNPTYQIIAILKKALHNTRGIRLTLWLAISCFLAITYIVNSIMLHLLSPHTTTFTTSQPVSLTAYILGQLTASLLTGPLLAGIMLNLLDQINQNTMTISVFFRPYYNSWNFSLCFFFCALFANLGTILAAALMTWLPLDSIWLLLIIILSAAISSALLTLAMPLLAREQEQQVHKALQRSCLTMLEQRRFISFLFATIFLIIMILLALTPLLAGILTRNSLWMITGAVATGYLEFWLIPIVFSLHATNYHILIE